MTNHEVICNVCINTFPIDLKQEMENYVNYVRTRGGQKIWVCFKCQEKLKGVVW